MSSVSVLQRVVTNDAQRSRTCGATLPQRSHSTWCSFGNDCGFPDQDLTYSGVPNRQYGIALNSPIKALYGDEK